MRKSLLALAAALFLLVTILFILLTTKPGLLAIQKTVNSFGGGFISIGAVDGRLSSAFIVNDLRLTLPAADVDIGKIEYQWRPGKLLSGCLEIVRGDVSDVEVTLKPSSGDMPPFFLPFSVKVGEFALRQLKIRDEAGEILFELNHFKTAFVWHDEFLDVRLFDLRSPEIGVDFSGEMLKKNIWNLDLGGNWYLAGYGFHPSRGTFDFKGSIDKINVFATLTDPGSIEVQGVVKNLLKDPTWEADVDARNVNLEKWIRYCPEIILSMVHGDMYGDFGHYRGHVEADGAWGVADKLHLKSEIDGHGLGIDFKSLRIDRLQSSAVATNGSISWAELFSWKADVDVKDFALSMFFPESDGLISAEIKSVGDVTDAGLLAEFKIPHMAGTIADYLWSAKGEVGLTEKGIFSQDLLVESDSVGGVAQILDAGFFWEEALQWKLIAELDDFDPGFVSPGLAGKINGKIANEMRWGEAGPVGSLSLESISGTVRGEKISGGGTFAIDGASLESDGFTLHLGGTSFEVSGGVEDELGVQFSFFSDDLADLGFGLGGSAQASGSLSGAKDAPLIALTLSGQGLSYGRHFLGSLAGDMTGGLTGESPVDARLVLDKVLLGETEISHGIFTLSGTKADHQLTTSINGPLGELSFGASGTYDKQWSGVLSGTQLALEGYGTWEQQQNSPVTVSSALVEMDRFCLSSSRSAGSGTGCFSGKILQNENIDWWMSSKLDGFDLQQLGKMGIDLPPLNGLLLAELEASGDKAKIRLASGRVDVPQVDTLLSVSDTDFVPLQLRSSSLKFDLEDGVLNAAMFVRSRSDGTLNIKTEVRDFGAFGADMAESPLAGVIVLDEYSIEPLAAVTGYMVEPTGWVSSTLRLDGTLGRPEIYGEIAVQEGGLELPQQGISLRDFVVSIDAREYGAYLRASASSGDGRLEARGVVSGGEEGAELNLQLEGKDFLLLNLPEYSIKVSPEAELRVNKDHASLSGRVLVPSGLIAPEEISGAVSTSEDVVFINTEAPPVKNGYPFLLDLDVTLGDDVKIDTHGLKGRLGGNLHVNITPADFITGKGELDLLDSTFTFYGRSLDIERGRVIFSGGPIDNPGVDIRAQKTISAETARDQEYTVGVDINGLVQDLQFNLFSDPYMDDIDILSQMVVGHSFDGSSEAESNILQAAAVKLGLTGSSRLMKGLTNFLFIDDLHLEGSTKEGDVSLVVGKRITEDLYIGYDMNMFSQLGQFRVRYDLSRGFYVETRSSSESTGADLIYSFER